MKKKIIILNIVLIIILYIILNNIFHIYIPCIFHEITGFLCPGCGMTRMLREIIHGNLPKAFYYNQFLFISLPIFIIIFINLIYSNFKNIKPLYQKIPNYIYYTYIVLLLVFGVVRNMI